jgi:hypothetical protein
LGADVVVGDGVSCKPKGSCRRKKIPTHISKFDEPYALAAFGSFVGRWKTCEGAVEEELFQGVKKGWGWNHLYSFLKKTVSEEEVKKWKTSGPFFTKPTEKMAKKARDYHHPPPPPPPVGGGGCHQAPRQHGQAQGHTSEATFVANLLTERSQKRKKKKHLKKLKRLLADGSSSSSSSSSSSGSSSSSSSSTQRLLCQILSNPGALA